MLGQQRVGALGVRPDSSTQFRTNIPQLVVGGHTWKALGVGEHRTVCGVTTAEIVFCWGNSGFLCSLPVPLHSRRLRPASTSAAA